MTIPSPEPGLVIRYSYLWLREYRQGRDEGAKDRPCAVILALADDEGDIRVTVLPVTHVAPRDAAAAFEIPAATKQRLGLDGERSWIVLDEGNEFIWPGPDLRPISDAAPGTFAYGFLPPRLFDVLRERFLARARRQQAHAIRRTE